VVIIAVEKMGFWRRSREAEPEVRIHSPPAVRFELDLGEGGFADEIAAAPPGVLLKIE
jgi:hypothetical protein